jgi:hypothetical protein
MYDRKGNKMTGWVSDMSGCAVSACMLCESLTVQQMSLFVHDK